MIRLRFNLKALFFVTTFIAIYLVIGVIRARRERDALRQIVATGGSAGYASSYFYPFRQVFVVGFGGRDFTDKELEAVKPYLGQLPGLTYLQFTRTGITDNGLKHLTELRRLETLDLWNNNITDAGLEDLKRLPSLRELDLSGTLVSDNGLTFISSMTGLRKIVLPGIPPPPPGNSFAAEYRRRAAELVEEEQFPGVISNRALASLRTTMKNCTVGRNSTWRYTRDSDDL